MGVQSFTKASAAGYAGKITGMMLGKVVNSFDHAMNALAEPEKFMEHALQAVKAPFVKLESKKTMAFASPETEFNGSLTHAFASGTKRGFTAARTKAPERKKKAVGASLKPSPA